MLSGLKTDRSGLKKTTSMERKMDSRLIGIKTDRRCLKITSRMERKMDF
jgi:hypothetical protein